MSEFKGKLDEIEELSIDRFDGNNLKSTAFFLSHCHSDHMEGLNSAEFRDALLKRDGVYLYCSDISSCILRNDPCYKNLTEKIKSLTTTQSHILTVPSFNAARQEICVTLIPAGHCPGSVMFLFELPSGNVLFTGDFRVTTVDFKNLSQLHHRDGTLKEIKSCYLDATFFDELYPKFPSREESLNKVCDLIKEWLAGNHSNEILLATPARYGCEHIFVGIKDVFGMKIHVQEDKFLVYRNIRKIGSAITSNFDETRIHACGKIHSDDGFTNSICQRCKTLLLTFNRFKETCQDSQLRLRRLRKQLMESRRTSVKESRVILEVNDPKKDVDIPSQEMVSDAVRPIAIWTVLQDGQLRANTANIKDEMIVSELLDDIASAEGASIEKEVAEEKLHIQEDFRHLEHHNYCSPLERTKDPEDSDKEETKDPEDSDEEEAKDPEDSDEEETTIAEKEETTIAEEEEWIKEANEKKMMQLHVVHPFSQVPNKQPDKAESQKNEDKKYSSLVLKDISGLLRIQDADGECKKKILISQNSRHVLRIPTLQGEPISGRNQGDPVLKVSKTLRRLDEDLQLKKGGKVVKIIPKDYCKSLCVLKGDKMAKIVQDISGNSNISLLKIKQRTPPLVFYKPSR